MLIKLCRPKWELNSANSKKFLIGLDRKGVFIIIIISGRNQEAVQAKANEKKNVTEIKSEKYKYLFSY